MGNDFLTSAFMKLSGRFRGGRRFADDSDDALQEAFCRLWRRRGDIRDEGEAENLLAVASRNIRIDDFRHRSAHPQIPIEDLSESIDDSLSDDVVEIAEEIGIMVRKCLSERDCNIFLLRDHDGWEFSEIASRYGLSESNVRLIVSRARKTVRENFRSKNNKI